MQCVNPITNLHCYDITLAGNGFSSGSPAANLHALFCIAAFNLPRFSFPAAI